MVEFALGRVVGCLEPELTPWESNVGGNESDDSQKQTGILSAYIAKKDLEEPIVEMEKPGYGAAWLRSPTAGGWSCRRWTQQPHCPLPLRHGGFGELEI